jgi:hypothetical protein
MAEMCGNNGFILGEIISRTPHKVLTFNMSSQVDGG